MMTIDLSPEVTLEVKALLSKYFGSETKIWVFGSRATGKSRRSSDLDLAVDMAGQEIPFDVMAKLSYDFEESNLPMKVDVVDINACSSTFFKLIEGDRVAF